MRPMVRVAGALAYRVAIEFATALGALRITDARLREQARKSTIGCVLNIAEGAGRRSRADKSRVYAIALGELCEAAAAVEHCSPRLQPGRSSHIVASRSSGEGFAQSTHQVAVSR